MTTTQSTASKRDRISRKERHKQTLREGRRSVQLVGRLRELALIRALECRERGAGPAQIAAEVDLSGRPCKLRLQVTVSRAHPIERTLHPICSAVRSHFTILFYLPARCRGPGPTSSTCARPACWARPPAAGAARSSDCCALSRCNPIRRRQRRQRRQQQR